MMNKSVIVPLYDRLVGRFSQKDIFHPETKKLIVSGGELITEVLADEIVNAGIKEVEIRSVLGCIAKGGICRKCYGRNLATGNVVELGRSSRDHGSSINW